MKVLIVDDEEPARERLRQLLGDIDGYEVAGLAGNGEEAVAMAAEQRPDIVLLDIRMPGMDGIEAAHHLNRISEPPAIVFATAYDQYAIDAFDARAIGYVLKPVRRARLAAALEQASKLAAATLSDAARASGLSAPRRHVCATARGEMILIPIEDISAFRADQKYVAVHHADGVSLIDESLKSLEEEFADSFVRIHRSVLVSVSAIESLQKARSGQYHVALRNDVDTNCDMLTVSRRHVAEVRKRLKES